MNLKELKVLEAIGELNLSMQDVMPMLSLAETVSLDAGEIYYQQGSNKPKLAFILSGLLRGYCTDINGRESTYVLRGENNIVACWEVILLDQLSNHTAEAVVETKLLSFDFSKIQTLIDGDLKLQQAYSRQLKKTYGQSLLHYQRFVNQKPEERYSHLIEEQPEVLDLIPQKIIASYLGVTPASLSRLKKRLKEKNTE